MVTEDARMALNDLRRESSPIKIDAVSHIIRQLSDGAPGRAVHINFHDAIRWFRNTELELESPGAQARNLIIWLGTRRLTEPDAAAYHTVSVGGLASIIGAKYDHASTSYVVNHLAVEKVVETLPQNARTAKEVLYQLRLTFKGWERFDELRREQRDSSHAFMAMAFNRSELEDVFVQCFNPAAQDAGFDLRRLTDGQAAGLIDAQLRVRIRMAKFLIADLSTDNRGAYWEAGFAEGLGRHVIYVCEESVWNHQDQNKRPHFDTNHLNTVVWSFSDLPRARQKLADMIRDTFPTEALMPNN
jgi:hypothetical protein